MPWNWELYRNYMENREFSKEAPQNFCQERATIAQEQGASEDKNFEAKPMLPKTDSPCCFGIPGWPKFSCDLDEISEQERQFLLGVGSSLAFLKNIDE